MNQEHIINNIKEVIYFSKLSRNLLFKQRINFYLCYKKTDHLIKILSEDIIFIIINHIKKNNWKTTKLLLN